MWSIQISSNKIDCQFSPGSVISRCVIYYPKVQSLKTMQISPSWHRSLMWVRLSWVVCCRVSHRTTGSWGLQCHPKLEMEKVLSRCLHMSGLNCHSEISLQCLSLQRYFPLVQRHPPEYLQKLQFILAFNYCQYLFIFKLYINVILCFTMSNMCGKDHTKLVQRLTLGIGLI